MGDKVRATASMGVKLKIFSDYENASTHASITIEKDVGEGNNNAALLYEAGQLYDVAREYVEEKIEEDIKSAKGGKKK